MGEEDIKAALRRITAETRELRRELETMIRDRSNHGRAVAADSRRRYQKSEPRPPSLAKRLGPKR
jgi:hypothetical protein